MKQPKVKYRAQGFDGDISEQEYNELKKEGLEVFELKPFLVDGQEEYLTDSEQAEMAKTFKVEPVKEAPASVSANLEKANKQAKAELWNENRNLSDFEYDKEEVPRPVNDDYFRALEETRTGRYTDAPLGRGEAQEVYAQTTDAVEQDYQKQKALREGRYPYTQLDNPQELKNRNLFYVDKLYSDTSLRLSADQLKELNDVDQQILENEKNYFKAVEAGDIDATLDYGNAVQDLKSIKKDLQSMYEPVEKAVEHIERNTGSEFLNKDEYGMAMKIQGLDDLYEKKRTNDAPELDQMIGDVEESLAKDFDKYFNKIDAEYGPLEDELAMFDNKLLEAERTKQESLRKGEDDPWTDLLITELERDRAVVEERMNERDKKKEFFINPEKAASDALQSVAYSGEAIPGKNAQEKARMLYSITAMQFEDGMKERFPEEFKTGVPSFSEFASKWKWLTNATGNKDAALSDSDKKLQELYSTLKALAPIAMLNRAPSLSNDTGWDVFKKTFVATQVPFNENGTDQEVAQKVMQSLALMGTSPEDFNKAQLGEIDEISSPYEHFSGKDFGQLTGTTGGLMVDIALSEMITKGFVGKSAASKALLSTGKARRADLGEAWIAGLKKPKENVLSRALWDSQEEGLRFSIAGFLSGEEEELNYASGTLGGAFASPIKGAIASKWVKQEGYQQLASLFGSKTPEAIAAVKNFGGALRLTGELGARGAGEVAEEFGNEIGNIYRESSSWEEVKKQWEARFGNMSDVMHFTLSSAIMGIGMGAGTSISDVSSANAKYWYNQLTEQEKIDFGGFLSELNNEWEYAADEARAVQEETQGTTEGEVKGEAKPANEPVAEQKPVGDTVVEGEQQQSEEANASEGGVAEEVKPTPETTVEDGEAGTTVVEDLGLTEDIGEVLEGGKKGKIGDTEVIVTENENEVVLESIKTDEGKTGKGSARKAMQKIVSSADKANKPIRLRAVPENDKTTQEGLEKLYGSFGFVKEGDEMVRQPGADGLDAYIEEVASTQSEEKVARAEAEKETKGDEVEYEGDGFTVRGGVFYDKKGKPFKRIPKKARLEYFTNVTLREDPAAIERRLQVIQAESSYTTLETWQNDVIGVRFRTKDVDDYFGKGRDNLKLRISRDNGIAVEDWILQYNMDPNNDVEISAYDVFEFLSNQDKSSAGMVIDPERRSFIEEFGFDPLTDEKAIFEAVAKISEELESLSKEELNELAEHDAKTAEEYEAYVNRKFNKKSKAASDSEGPKGTTEQVLDFLDDIEARLDAFGSESLSMGPAIVAGKAVIQAVRVAVKAGKSIAEAIEAGVAALRGTDWYKAMTADEKAKAEADVSRLVKGETSNNVFVPDGKARDVKVGSNAEKVLSGMNKVYTNKKKKGSFFVKKNRVILELKDRPDGSVEIVSVSVPEAVRREGRALKAIREVTRLAHAMGVDVHANMTSGAGRITSKGMRALFGKAGYQSSPSSPVMYYAPADGGVSDTEKNVQTAIFNLWHDKINNGASLEEMQAEVDRSNWDERSGLTKDNLKKLLANMYERYSKNQLSEASGRRRMRSISDRLLELEELTSEERELLTMNGDISYVQLRNEKVEELAKGIFDEIIKETGDLRTAWNAYMDAYDRLKPTEIDLSSSARAVHMNILAKFLDAAEGVDEQLHLEIHNVYSPTGTSLGQGVQQMSEVSSPEALKNRTQGIVFKERDKKIGADKEQLEALAVELRKTQKEVIEKEIDVERTLNELAAKDKRIADLLDKIDKAEAKANVAASKASSERNTIRKKPNRTAEAAKKYADKLDKFADDIDNMTFASLVPPSVIKAALKAAAATLRTTANTIIAIEDAIKELKKAPEYEALSDQGKSNVRQDVVDILKQNIDGLDKDIQKLAGITPDGSKKKKSRPKKAVPIAQLISDHLAGKTKSKEDLANKIAAETGIKDADALSYLAEELMDKIQDKVAKAIEKKIKDKFDKAKKMSKKQINQTAQELAHDVLNGNLSDADVLNGFSSYYNFPKITKEVVEKLGKLSDLLWKLQEAKDNAASGVVVEHLNKFMRENTNNKQLYIKTIQEFMIASTLSGVGTQTNAFVGGLSELIPGLITETMYHWKRPAAIAASLANLFSNGTIWRAMNQAYAAGVKNQNDIASYGAYTEQLGNRFIDGGLNKMVADAPWNNKGVFKKLAAATIQGLRINFLLGAYDAFKNTTAKEYLEYLDEWSRQSSATDKTWMQRAGVKNIKAIRDMVDNNMNPQDDAQWMELFETTYQERLEQMKEAGVKPPLAYKQRLKQDMINNYRKDQEVELHIDTIKDIMLMSTPKGTVGARLYSAARKLEIKEGDSMVVMVTKLFGTASFIFPRIAIKSMGRVADSLPLLGLAPYVYRAITKSEVIYKDGKVQKSPLSAAEAQKQLMKGAIKNVMWIGIYSALLLHIFDFEDDDEEKEGPAGDMFGGEKTGPRMFGSRIKLNPNRLFDVTGDMSDWRLDKATADKNYQPMMLRFRMSPEDEWTNVVKTQYMVSGLSGLHLIGTWRDKLMYGDPEKMNDSELYDIGEHAALAIGELSFNQFFRDVKRIAQSEEGELLPDMLAVTATRPLTALTPRIYRDVIQASLSDETKRYESASGSSFLQPMSNYWVMQWLVDDIQKVDSYGYPLEYANNFSKAPIFSTFIDPYWTEHSKDKKQYELFLERPNVIDRKITKGQFTELNMYDNKRKSHGYARDFTDEERTALTIAARRLYGRALEQNYSELKALGDEDFKAATTMLREKSAAEARIQYSHIVSSSKGAKKDLIEPLLNLPIFRPPNN